MELYVIFFILGLFCLVLEMLYIPIGLFLTISISAFALSFFEYHGKLQSINDYLAVSLVWGSLGLIWMFVLFRKKKNSQARLSTDKDINDY